MAVTSGQCRGAVSCGVLQGSADDLAVVFWQVAAARLPGPDDRQAPLPRPLSPSFWLRGGAAPGSGAVSTRSRSAWCVLSRSTRWPWPPPLEQLADGQRSAVPRIRLPGMSLRPVRCAGGGRQTVLWLPAAGESACRPAAAPGLRMIRLAWRAGRVVPGGVATSRAAAVIAGDSVPGSQHRAGGSAAVQRGGRRGADAGLADRGGGRVRGDRGSRPGGRRACPGVGSSRRPGLRPVLNAWARAAAVVLPAGQGSARAMVPGAGSPRSRQRDHRRHGRRRGWCARAAGARWERSWRVSFPIRATSVRKTSRDGRI